MTIDFFSKFHLQEKLNSEFLIFLELIKIAGNFSKNSVQLFMLENICMSEVKIEIGLRIFQINLI